MTDTKLHVHVVNRSLVYIFIFEFVQIFKK